MRFRTWDFDPTPCIHSVINNGAWDRTEQCAQYCPATASADFHRNFIFTVWSHAPKFSVNYHALKLCWFSNSVSLMRDIESCPFNLHCFIVSSRFRPALAVTDSESTCLLPCPSDLRRTWARRSAIYLALVPSIAFKFRRHSDMNFAAWRSRFFKI